MSHKKTKSNPKGAGRPIGSRNKQGLIKAQNALDKLTVKAVDFLENVIDADTKALGLDDDEVVEIKERMGAAKIVLDKAIANEKEKLKREGASKPTAQEETPEEDDRDEVPLVSSKALED